MVKSIRATLKFSERQEVINAVTSILSNISSAVNVASNYVSLGFDEVTLEQKFSADTAEAQAFIDFLKTFRDTASFGLISKHNCHHDEQLPCEAETIVDTWGVNENA